MLCGFLAGWKENVCRGRFGIERGRSRHYAAEKNRADILWCDPANCQLSVYAYGIRNAGGGLAVNPQTGELWCSVNERDGLGDNLVPITSRTSRKADSTAGRGGIWAGIRIRGIRVNIRS